MLTEEQTAALLSRCESLVGITLSQVRGNLKRARSRAAAVWELIVLDEMARTGPVRYECLRGPSPDICLALPSSQQVWIEVAFLYPGHWREERQSQAVVHWTAREARRLGIAAFKVSCHFEGDRNDPRGPVRTLPNIQERGIFLGDSAVRLFFEAIKRNPTEDLLVKHPRYSLELRYCADAEGPYLTSSGLAQDSPRDVKHHALYRVLKEKARQHKLTGMRIVCIGTDGSAALSHMTAPGRPRLRDAVAKAFSETRSLSAVLLVRIESVHVPLQSLERRAVAHMFLNPNAREPLSQEALGVISRLDFNRWHYWHPLVPYERSLRFADLKNVGPLVIRSGGSGVNIEIPATVVLECLTGRTDLFQTYEAGPNDPVTKPLRDGWVISGCAWKDGDVESGEAPKIVLEMRPSSGSVYGAKD